MTPSAYQPGVVIANLGIEESQIVFRMNKVRLGICKLKTFLLLLLRILGRDLLCF